MRQGTTTVVEKVTHHDAFGRPKRTELGNGLITQHEHDLLGRITRIRTGPSATPQSIQDLEYQWRSNGRLHFRRDRRDAASGWWTETFAYDVFDRVTQATTVGAAPSNRVLGFGYDTTSFGNLTSKTSNVAGDVNVTGMTYTNPHRLTGATIGGVGHMFQYDAAGNITKYVASGADDTELDYDARGQVTRITVGSLSNPTARDQFWYDPDGDRFLKRATWSGGGDAWALYLLGGAFEQMHPVHDAAITHRRQVQVSGTVVHRRTQAANGTVTTLVEYRHRDHLGSVSAVTDTNGAIVTKLAFDPFGARRKSDWTGDLISAPGVLMGLGATTDRGFTDHEHLDRTGFIHMNGRVYDPRIGRFVQPDPIVQAPFFSQSYNRYAYVFNSPLSFTDPSGYCADSGSGAGENHGTLTCVWGIWDRGVPPSMVDFPAGYQPNTTPPSTPVHRVAGPLA